VRYKTNRDIWGLCVCRIFTVRVVTQLFVCVCGHGDSRVDFVVYLCAEDGLRAKDSIGLPETMDCERPRVGSNNMHQSKVSVTRIARVGTLLLSRK
jgi:hypothetical protein